MLRRTLSVILWLLPISLAAQTARHITLHYSFTVKNVEQGKPLKIWFPMAHSDPYQDVRIVSAGGDMPLKRTKDSEYGNSLFYASAKHANKAEYHFAVDYDVVRHEHKYIAASAAAPLSSRQRKRLLEADALVPVTGLPAELAAKTVRGASSEMDKAHAIYEYVFENMRYDKSGTGWGHGDTLWACSAKRGNCTDFHSLFISMSRSQGIPALFEIGLPLPASKSTGQIAGYHCWTEFYVDGTGWVPIDISEAWKDPAKREYFFGANDVNRVQFTVGRDLRLNPPQQGAPLNYFIYPYVEVDGKSWPNIDQQFSFEDAPTRTQTASLAVAR